MSRLRFSFWRQWELRKFLDWGFYPPLDSIYVFFSFGPIELKWLFRTAAILDIELERPNGVNKCIHCEIPITKDNYSGWDCFTETGTQSICIDCQDILGKCAKCGVIVKGNNGSLVKIDNIKITVICDNCFVEPIINRVRQRGQAMVEMALIAPLLVFFMIGVLEVGWALRNYLVLTNASREAARFASRPDYLNLESEFVGFQQVYSHTIDTVSEQLDMADMVEIVSIIRLDAQYPCDPEHVEDCDCMLARTNPYSPTIIEHPGMISFTHLMTVFPTTSTQQSWIDFNAQAEELAQFERQFSCQQMKESPSIVLRKHDIVTAELFFQHKQVFGFPIIANPYTDPLLLYGHTTMRIMDARKSAVEITVTVEPTAEP